MNTKELVKKLTAGMPKRIDNNERRRQARSDFSRGRSMSLFDRAHNEPIPNRKVWTLFDSRNFASDSGETDTTGFKESNRASHAAAEENSRQNRERVDASIERGESQGEVVDNAEPEDQQWAERTQEPLQPQVAKRFLNEVERSNYERLGTRTG